METTDYTQMSRNEIREELTAAIGDDELPESVRESLVLTLEDETAVTADEFWVHVESAYDAYRDF